MTSGMQLTIAVLKVISNQMRSLNVAMMRFMHDDDADDDDADDADDDVDDDHDAADDDDDDGDDDDDDDQVSKSCDPGSEKVENFGRK